MGKKPQWDAWSGQWGGQSSSSYGWHPKGGGKDWSQKWNSDKAENWFPGYEMMQPKQARQQPDGRSPGYTEPTEGDGSQTGELMHHIQKLINTIRKADARTRKSDKEKEEVSGKWESFQDGLKQAFIKERTKVQERLRRIKEEAKEHQETKASALTALQDLFVNNQLPTDTGAEQREAINAEWDKLTSIPDDPMEGLPSFLAAAIQSGGAAKDKARRQLMSALGVPAEEAASAATPERRPRAARSTTPPPTRTAHRPSPPPPEGENVPYGEVSTNNDPYMTSPTHHGPTAVTPLAKPRHKDGARLNIKLQGRAPSQPRISKTNLADKLHEKRAAAAEEISEIVDTDEDMPIGNLPKSHREGG